jgi:prepilin-type N-terminal cleavage/methylation domain-containing protein
MRSGQQRGFSLIEMAVTLAILMIASSVCFISLKPAMRQNRVNNAYNLALSGLRRAREAAISERRIYIVTFDNSATPNKVSVTQGTTGVVKYTLILPNDITFRAESGIPTSSSSTPDGFGTGSKAIDFDQGVGAGGTNTVYFYPDGSSHDAAGNSNSGVVYLARSGELMSSRAVTVWGLTGRIRGWRIEKSPSAGTYYWRQE